VEVATEHPAIRQALVEVERRSEVLGLAIVVLLLRAGWRQAWPQAQGLRLVFLAGVVFAGEDATENVVVRLGELRHPPVSPRWAHAGREHGRTQNDEHCASILAHNTPPGRSIGWRLPASKESGLNC
jgi:hypothetical protein